MLSLDMKVGDNESTTLGNMLQDTSSGDPENEVLSEEMVHELQKILMELSDRERRVMSYRLRMSGHEDDLVIRENLAKEMSLSRERIRQIEIQAIKKLRAVAQKRRLRELLSG